MLLITHCHRRLLYCPVLPIGHTVLLRCVSAREFSPNSFLLQITRELVREVLLPAIKPLDLPSSFPFNKAFHLQETAEDFTLLRDQAHPSVPSVVIDEGYKVTASSDAHVLCWSPYIRMDHIDQISTPITLVEEWKSVLLPELTGFADMAVPTTRFRQAENNVLRLQGS